MYNSNICKFNPVQSSDLNCLNFVYEKKLSHSNTATAKNNSLHLAVLGSGTLECNGNEYPISPGTLFFVGKGESFSIVGSNLEYLYISFEGRRGNELVTRLGLTKNGRIHQGHEDLIEFWNNCLTSSVESNLDLLSEAVLLYTLARITPSKDSKSDMISKVLSITSENFSNHTLSLSYIADKVGYHEKYVSARFKKEMGISFSLYLRNVRVDHAVFLMEQGVVSVKNVALLSGFSDSLYFSKVFKEIKGVSPKEFIHNL